MAFSRPTTARPASGHERWQHFQIYCSAAGADRGSCIYIFNSPSGSGIPLRRWVMAIPVIGGMPWFLDNLACVGRGDNHAPPAAGSWQLAAAGRLGQQMRLTRCYSILSVPPWAWEFAWLHCGWQKKGIPGPGCAPGFRHGLFLLLLVCSCVMQPTTGRPMPYTCDFSQLIYSAPMAMGHPGIGVGGCFSHAKLPNGPPGESALGATPTTTTTPPEPRRQQ